GCEATRRMGRGRFACGAGSSRPTSSAPGRRRNQCRPPDGKILVVGSSYDPLEVKTALTRYEPDGRLDPTSGDSGLAEGDGNDPPEVAPTRDHPNETTGGTPDDFLDPIPDGLGPPDDDLGRRGPRAVPGGPARPDASRPPPGRVSCVFHE